MSDCDNYLKHEQYRNSQNLGARIALHLRYSQNPYGWCRWVFDQLVMPGDCTILELGCGPGGLWQENRDRIPTDWQVTLSDFSPGMLADCQANLASCGHPFAYEIIDAQRIHRPESSLDGVIANHMLYHVPDRNQAFGEIQRVLKPGGLLFASTVGESHMHELYDLARRCGVEWKSGSTIFTVNFTLENGFSQLAPWFEDIRLERYPDSLVVTDAEAIVAYLYSGSRVTPELDYRHTFKRFLEEEIRREGSIRISKDSGIFIARKMAG